MGYVTQSRTSPDLQVTAPYLWKRGTTTKTGAGTTNPLIGVPIPMQTTMSFRSGKTAERGNDDEPIPTSYDEAFRQYRKDYRKKQRHHDTGHEFWTTKQDYTLSHPQVRKSGVIFGVPVSYQGHLVPDLRHSSGRDLGYPSVGAISGAFYGPRAIERTRPTAPVADLAVTLSELRREGMPSPTGSEMLRSGPGPRSLGSEYLNLEFGFKPLANEIAALAYSITDAKRIIAQYARDSGKWVRRSYSFPEEVSVVRKSDTVGNIYNVPNDSYFIGTNSLYSNASRRFTESVRTTRNVWFSGAYSYHLPDGKNLLDKMKRFEAHAQKLTGIRITPEVLWNLTPWSWFGDWNATLGSSISNFSTLGSDGQVIVYGYLMATTVVERTCTVHGVPSVGDCSLTLRATRKERIKASPYGFGSNPSAYSSRQWAILAALGLTKAPTSLF